MEAEQTMTVQPGSPAVEAIPMLLDTYGGRIFALGLRMCGNAPEAEDLLQDTFLQAFRRWETFEGRADPGTWLHTIAARACARRHRRRSGEPESILSIEQLAPFGESTLADPETAEKGPLAEQIRREAVEAVERGIISLPALYRLPLVLKDILELSIAQVAEALELPEGTVKTRLHRARLLIRNEMAHVLPAAPSPEAAYERQVCLDLLRVKLNAMDHGHRVPFADDVMCERCRKIFMSLDLASDLCRRLREGELPEDVRRRVLEVLATNGAIDRHDKGRPPQS
jgi:RNA polymerase sigma-70 factor (ECF subfamily)